MIFKDRQDAGRQFAKSLCRYARRPEVVVLGIPRGGVPVAHQIASDLSASLNLLLAVKLSVPGQEEIAYGALTEANGCYIDESALRHVHVTKEQILFAQQRAAQKLEAQTLLYRKECPPADTKGRTVILVDDGAATGATLYAAIQAVKSTKPSRIVLAVPVAPVSTCRWLSRLCDEAIFLSVSAHFYAVSDAYQNFCQVTDQDVMAHISNCRAA